MVEDGIGTDNPGSDRMDRLERTLEAVQSDVQQIRIDMTKQAEWSRMAFAELEQLGDSIEKERDRIGEVREILAGANLDRVAEMLDGIQSHCQETVNGFTGELSSIKTSILWAKGLAGSGWAAILAIVGIWLAQFLKSGSGSATP